MIDRSQVLLLTGASGMIGAATLRLLQASGFSELLFPSSKDLDLTDATAVDYYFQKHRPRYVLMVAAKVGGIGANIDNPVDFTDINLRIALNLFAACHKYKAEKSLFLGSSCIYPAGEDNLIPEEALLSGSLEPTNEGYALAKIVGLKLARYYGHQYGLVTVCPMMCNVYGTGDHFDFGRAHVLSSLVRRFVDARDAGLTSVTLWGTGIARREFMHSDDAARSILFFIDHVDTTEHINVGSGHDIAICELADLVAEQAGFRGQILWDSSKPNGMMRKCLDVTKLKELGFELNVRLSDGILRTISEYEEIKAKEGTLL